MALQWQISGIRRDEGCVVIEGYSHNFKTKPSLLDATIRRFDLKEFLSIQEPLSHEGRNLVIVKRDECYLIEVHVSGVEDSKFIQNIPRYLAELFQKQLDTYNERAKKSIDCFECIGKNELCDKFYFGLPEIVFMTFVGMIVTDI